MCIYHFDMKLEYYIEFLYPPTRVVVTTGVST